MAAIEKSRFEWVGPNKEKSEGITRPAINFWKDAFMRLKKNKVAIFCIFTIIFILLCQL